MTTAEATKPRSIKPLDNVGQAAVRQYGIIANRLEKNIPGSDNPYNQGHGHEVPHGIVDAPGAAGELRRLRKAKNTTSPTIEVVDRICEVLKEGNHLDTALSVARVLRSDWRAWMKVSDAAQEKEDRLGEHAKLSEHQELCLYAREASFAASRDAERQLVSLVTEAAETDWRAAAWMLARRFPKAWGSARETHKPAAINIGVSPGVMLLQAPAPTVLEWQGSIPTMAQVLQTTSLIDVEVLGEAVEAGEIQEGDEPTILQASGIEPD